MKFNLKNITHNLISDLISTSQNSIYEPHSIKLATARIVILKQSIENGIQFKEHHCKFNQRKLELCKFNQRKLELCKFNQRKLEFCKFNQNKLELSIYDPCLIKLVLHYLLYIISFDLSFICCSIYVLYKIIFSNKLGFIQETSLFL